MCNKMMAGLFGRDSAKDSEEVHHVGEPYSPKFEHVVLDLLNVDPGTVSLLFHELSYGH